MRWSLLALLAALAFPASAPANPATQIAIVAGFFGGALEPGTPFQANVFAADAGFNVDFNFTGTVHFTSSDPQATLPPDTVVTGLTPITITMPDVGQQTITATQVGGSLTGTSSVLIFPFAVKRITGGFPGVATSGVPLTFTVTARDRNGNPVPSYNGAIHVTSSDPAATLPPDTRLTNGTGTLTATLRTPGTQTITAADASLPASFRTTAGITVERPAARLQLAGPLTTLAGFPAFVGVRALDATGAVAGTYAGTVHFTSTDAHAQLPADVKLANGQASVQATFNTLGLQTISAADTTVTGIAGTSPELLVGTADAPAPAPPLPSPGGSAPPPPPAAAPVVRGLAVKPLCVSKARLLSAPRRGSGRLALSFTLSADARVSVSVGRLVHATAPARCPRTPGSAKGAVKLVRTLRGSASAGRDALAIASRAGRRAIALAAAAKALAPGAYVVQVRATAAAGRRSALASAKFFVLR
jgi:hypothetical protein